MKIIQVKVENLRENCITDNPSPRISFAIDSDRAGSALKEAQIRIGNWKKTTDRQVLIPYEGTPLAPFTKYTVEISATDVYGDTDSATAEFETGRLSDPWEGEWITDRSYRFREKRVSPKPMCFRKEWKTEKPVRSAKIYSTAIGIYELELNGKKVGKDYFAPGFTTYKSQLQYQVYDVTEFLGEKNELTAIVAGGWAVGSFVFTRANRITAKRQAFLAEIRIVYADGSEEVIGTDESWQVSEDGPFRMADIYDGETYDATVDYRKIGWKDACKENISIHPTILAAYGAPVQAHEVFLPVSVKKDANGVDVYDFGQNFAGVVKLKIKRAVQGQVVVVRHAEVLRNDGSLNTAFLRTAKATATYVCKDGAQEYSPRLTYMGFRYVSVEGISAEDVEVSAVALYSNVEQVGSFVCSDGRINRLQQNIVWGARSNFVDIPTDCPQRDERMGWTGDIAVFAQTACYNFDMSRFLEKWLKDMRSEQLKTGGIPNTIPSQGYRFPTTMPYMAVAFWGDACILVPWAEYLARGDLSILAENYPMMKQYVKACAGWAKMFSVGKKRYIWSPLPPLNFGDWVAPDVPQMSAWQARGKWTSTASLCNTCKMLSVIAELLGKADDAKQYREFSEKVADAYVSVFTDGNGKMKEEFQTAYVLPLYYKMFGDRQKEAVKNLVRLVEKSDYCIGTGFPGTPYILFALADNGEAETAYKMLTCEKCPSWLYEVRVGATTIWERWDGLDENGTCTIGDDGTGGMISFNHYASGAVGDFLYRRVLGIEPTDGGYKTFDFKPVSGGGITFAKGSVNTPYGKVAADWKAENGAFTMTVSVPCGTVCRAIMPSGRTEVLQSGTHRLEEPLVV